MTIRRNTLLGGLAAITLAASLTACTDASGTATAPTQSPTLTAAEATPTPTPTESPTAESSCGLEFMGAANRMADSWDRVEASYGESDHEEMVESFYEAAAGLSDKSDPECAGDAELAALTYDVSGLRLQVVATENVDPAEYSNVHEALVAWMITQD